MLFWKINDNNSENNDEIELIQIIKNVHQSGINRIDIWQEETYLNKFIPIRKISSISSFDITFDYITLNKKLYEKTMIKKSTQ